VKDKVVRLDCKALLKAYEIISNLGSKYDEDFPEMLSFMYLLTKGYWVVDDDWQIKEAKKPPFSMIYLLDIMKEITEKVRDGTTIEEIVNEKELCGDEEWQ